MVHNSLTHLLVMCVWSLHLGYGGLTLSSLLPSFFSSSEFLVLSITLPIHPALFFFFFKIFIYFFFFLFFIFLHLFLLLYSIVVVFAIHLFIYFWMHWVFIAFRGLSLGAASEAYFLVVVHRLLFAVASCCRAWALGCVGFSSRSTWAL